jgi:CheY-like chemotaxis protein
MLALRADEKGLLLRYVVAPDVPDLLRGDPGRLRQIIVNLVGNAVKFTPNGEIVVKVEADATEQFLHFIVSDTGIGIPLAKQQSIFNPFTQADTSTTRRYGGTGLGLTISARLIELMGGTIWVESQVGQGTRFHFTARLLPKSERTPYAGGAVSPDPLVLVGIPVAQRITTASADAPRTFPQAGESVAHLRILVAEDNAVNQLVMTRLLEKRGHRVTLAATGREALEALAKDRYDLVFMDIQMPEMGGIEATEAIRASEKSHDTHLLVIALTADAMKGDRERYLAAGMDDYLAKPIGSHELDEVLSRYEHSRAAGRDKDVG